MEKDAGLVDVEAIQVAFSLRFMASPFSTHSPRAEGKAERGETLVSGPWVHGEHQFFPPTCPLPLSLLPRASALWGILEVREVHATPGLDHVTWLSQPNALYSG